MVASPRGIDGSLLIRPFSRMARGMNALHERNPSRGAYDHPHGWGAVYAADGGLQVIRGVLPFWADPKIDVLRDVRVFLLHARRASVGAVTKENTHPFAEERSGKVVYFCHNGTINDPLIAEYLGETDSLRYFRYLLDRFDERDPEGSLTDAIQGLGDYIAANAFLLADDLFCVINRYQKYRRYYTIYRARDVFSSEPLSEIASDWRPLENGSVICLSC